MNITRVTLFSLLILVWTISSVSQADGNKLDATLYSYHDKAPYHVVRGKNPESGIYQEVVNYLNAKQSQYHIVLEYVPRKRLEQRLELGELDGAVIGVSPVWFKDKAQTKYLWSEPFMRDSDVVISRKDAGLEYNRNKDLIGLRMALPRGLYFWGVTELVNEGKIPVFKTNSDRQSFTMLLHNKAKATITSILTYRTLSQEMEGSEEVLVIQNRPHDQFLRRLLFPKQLAGFKQAVDPHINKMLSDSAWLSTLKKYGYEH